MMWALKPRFWGVDNEQVEEHHWTDTHKSAGVFINCLSLLSLPPSPLSLSLSFSPSLPLTIQYYRKPLLALSTTSQPIISERDVNTIFYRVEDLFALHTSLHDKLDLQLQDWGVHSCVADFFLELVCEHV